MRSIRKLYVPLNSDERRALGELAEREKRDLRDQAALIIRKALEARGLLPKREHAEEPRKECDDDKITEPAH